MTCRPCLVVTSIAGPTAQLRSLAARAETEGVDFVVVGDEGSPTALTLRGCEFFDLADQLKTGFLYAERCPTRHYARKNIGYLIAMLRHAPLIVETDDDTIAYEAFWEPRSARPTAGHIAEVGWINVYRYFSQARIWPRGFPLNRIDEDVPDYGSLDVASQTCPIQQGLVDDDPDVDAIYRLLLQLPIRFESTPAVALGSGAWSPFNSQNTTWFPEAYPLLYLPSYCSFRVTDIWRSFVAQRIAWANGWSVLFHRATVKQDRNAHDLMRDFRDEVPSYLHNSEICATLERLDLPAGVEQIGHNMRCAYAALVEGNWIDRRELSLLDAWLADVEAAQAGSQEEAVDMAPAAPASV
jgi:STELLO glycosyltransferases